MNTTILIVDDESDNIDIVADYLEQENPHFQLLQASNGQMALKSIEKNLPDLILTDWNMPVMDGLELVKALKANERTRDIPVIMQTAETEDTQLKKAFEAGVMDYIKKPVSRLELIARVKSALALRQAQKRTEELLLNILPKEVAEELKEKGEATPRYFKSASILFADVNGFSATARRMKDQPQKLVKKLAECFDNLDDIAIKYNLERIKTIGDCYMAVAGIPNENTSHALDIVLSALAMQAYMENTKANTPEGEETWQVRLGIHSGDLVAGVIGKVKFAYDVWGDSVNLASRMESTGEVGKIHITENTYELIADFFECEKKAELVYAKNIGDVQTYFVHRLKPEYAADELGYLPNDKFYALRKEK